MRLASKNQEFTDSSLKNKRGDERRSLKFYKEQTEVVSQRTNDRPRVVSFWIFLLIKVFAFFQRPHDDLVYANYDEEVFHDCLSGEECKLESTSSDILRRACHIVQVSVS